MYAT
jgi:hypothetical protein